MIFVNNYTAFTVYTAMPMNKFFMFISFSGLCKVTECFSVIFRKERCTKYFSIFFRTDLSKVTKHLPRAINRLTRNGSHGLL